MSVINYESTKQVLVTVKGHPYQRDDFAKLLESLSGVAYSVVEQPACQALFQSHNIQQYDALVAYDMPGINFATQPPQLVAPSEAYKNDFLRMLDNGKGVVFLHHSIAAWPLWPEYADIVGGRFWYLPQIHKGRHYADGGYRHDTEHRVSVLADHPLTAGIPEQFALTDELYLYDVFDDGKLALLESDFPFAPNQFYSATEAVSGRMYSRENWQREGGSSLVGWVKHYRNSPIVYLQMGDGPTAYQHPTFRKLLSNALHWVMSPEAHAWARQRHQLSDPGR